MSAPGPDGSGAPLRPPAPVRRVAVMQPYFLPYIGYWQLLDAADVFVIYDTVASSPPNWVNRNRIRVGDELRWLTVPLRNASHCARLEERLVSDHPGWRGAMLRRVAEAHRGSAHRDRGLHLLERLLAMEHRRLVDLLAASIRMVADELGLDSNIGFASTFATPPAGPGSSAQGRLVSLCVESGATDYVNLPGGRALYDPSDFLRHGIRLSFLRSPAAAPDGTPERDDQTLSILDLLMRHDVADIAAMIGRARWEAAQPGERRRPEDCPR